MRECFPVVYLLDLISSILSKVGEKYTSVMMSVGRLNYIMDLVTAYTAGTQSTRELAEQVTRLQLEKNAARYLDSMDAFKDRIFQV